MRRGFLRWRNSDSDLPFWNRKTLLSPRTYSLPCGAKHGQNSCIFTQNKSLLPSRRRNSHPGPRLASFDFGSRGHVAARLGGGKFGVRRNRWNGPSVPCRGRSAGRRKNRRTFSFWRWLSSCRCRVASSESKVQGSRSIFAKFFGAGCGIGLPCDRLRCEPPGPAFADVAQCQRASDQATESHIRIPTSTSFLTVGPKLVSFS